MSGVHAIKDTFAARDDDILAVEPEVDAFAGVIIQRAPLARPRFVRRTLLQHDNKNSNSNNTACTLTATSSCHLDVVNVPSLI